MNALMSDPSIRDLMGKMMEQTEVYKEDKGEEEG
ncbi:MAG: hypothetical protein A4E23_01571 [Methanomethylovorans sp. PtaU1.Bin073]|nr:MAG: hypothetical protein A4E23_01571 [Methanomethylovorans sp. PtaU1.Bin073]